VTADVMTPENAAADSMARRRAGWMIVARKELADHLLSWRFVILVLVLGLAAVVPLYFAADAIRSVASQINDTRAVFLALFVVPPSTGITLPPVYGFVGIVGPLLGVAFAFDAINSERADGTLPRLLSQPIYRDDVINGKFAAGLAVITIALFSVVLVISGFGIVRLGVVPALSEVFRLAAWFVLAVVWIAFWLAFGLVLSVIIRRAATAALIGFGTWLLVAIFGQIIVSLVAGVLAPVATATSVDQAVSLQALSDTIQRFLPLTLYQEGARVLLNPTVTTVSTPVTVSQLQQYQQQVPSLLSLDQSILLVWPHFVILIALTVVFFAIAYIRFMRQEVRA